MENNGEKKNIHVCKTESLCYTAEIGTNCKSTTLQLKNKEKTVSKFLLLKN